MKHFAIITLAGALGCTGTIDGAAGGVGVGGSGSTGAGGVGAGAAGGSGGGPTPIACDSAAATPPLRARRLTRAEYDATVRDLLGDASGPAKGFSVDEKVGVFANNTIAPVTDLGVEQYQAAAEQLATTATEPANLQRLLPCASTGDEACAVDFIRTFGKRAFRRPLVAEEVEDLRRLYAQAYADAGGGATFATRIKLIIQAILQAPSFLYRIEVGTPVLERPGVARLGDHELATRLSYLFWGTTPDADLLAAADAGRLATPAGIEAEARRLIASDRFGASVDSFHVQWLDLDHLSTAEKDPVLYPTFGPTLAGTMMNETKLFARDVVQKGDAKLRTLLTSPVAYVNKELAAIYGISYSGNAVVRVALPATERAGLLTQAGFLTMHATRNQSSPIRRGLIVRQRLLCQTPPPPPPDVQVVAPDPKPGLTTRERFAEHVENPVCASCHQLFDPIGFGFESYDGVGTYRASEGDKPIDASGQLLATADADGPFNGAVELSARLAGSNEVQGCVVRLWLEYAVGQPLMDDQQCVVDGLRDAFVRSDGDMRALLLALAQSDAFRHGRSLPGGTP